MQGSKNLDCSSSKNGHLLLGFVSAFSLASFVFAPVLAQSGNDFFGSSVPSAGGGPGSIERPPGVAAAEQQALKSSGNEYTSDEKRMQKKYKANLKAAGVLISKGEKMIKDGNKRKDDKMVKKGQILKEVGEKRVKELKEDNPMSENQ